MLLTVARQTLVEAVHARLTWLLLILLLLAWLFAGFLGVLALTEHRAIEGAVLASLARLASVLLIVLFVVASVLREQQDGSLESMLALAEPRSAYVLGKALAHAALALLLALACGLLLALEVPLLRVLPWTLSLACELVLAAALGLLLAFTFRQTVGAVAAFTVVYLLARAMGALLLMLQQPTFGPAGALQGLIEYFVTGLAWILPSLYRFTDAGWLAGAGPPDGAIAHVLGQTLIYLPLLLAAAMVDLYRREF